MCINELPVNYYISAVDRGTDGRTIRFFKVNFLLGGNIADPINVVCRDTVLSDIRDGRVVMTAFLENGQLQAGAIVFVTDDGLLRTVANGTEQDNLGGLPEFTHNTSLL